MTVFVFTWKRSCPDGFLDMLKADGFNDIVIVDEKTRIDDALAQADETISIFLDTAYDFNYATFAREAKKFDGIVHALSYVPYPQEGGMKVSLTERYELSSTLISSSNSSLMEHYAPMSVIYNMQKRNKGFYGIPFAAKPFTGTRRALRPALFLDRDGVLIEDSGYVRVPSDVLYLDDALEIMLLAKEKGYAVYVLTNQSGVARGFFGMDAVYAVNTAIAKRYKEKNAAIDGFYVCPYHSEGANEMYAKESLSRKPHPGMALSAALEHDIDLARSIMVGDKDSDVLQLPYLRSFVVPGRYETKRKENIATYEEIATYLSR